MLKNDIFKIPKSIEKRTFRLQNSVTLINNELKSILNSDNWNRKSFIFNYYRGMRELLTSSILGNIFCGYLGDASNQNWWNLCTNIKDDDEKIQNYHNYDTYLKVSLIILSFSITETYYRDCFRMALKCDEEIKSYELYKKLRKQLEIAKKEKQENRFALHRLVRNCFHNGGHHFKKNDSVNYNNTNYCFVNGKSPQDITWDLVIDIIDDTTKDCSDFFDSKFILDNERGQR
ncbi:hypothetical protein HN958_00420 [Candidatus Falkowbacteria bacterium]|jgi:low affinity Fe/Cu permease|nr:hypothetical protein [Candidatus Falkowbacteria bacterium]MBT7006953.1 hypothetical protein [Candidatus Falkowbacteria bacterium]